MSSTSRRDLMVAMAAAAAAPAAVANAKTVAKSGPAAEGSHAALSTLYGDIALDLMHSLPETATLMGLDEGKFGAAKHRLNDRSAAERSRFVAASGIYRKRLKAIDRNSVHGVQLAVYDTLDYWLAENVAQ